MFRIFATVVALIAITLMLGQRPAGAADEGLNKIEHVIVIYQENWSFDGLYGSFPNANGLKNAGEAARQLDRQGKLLPTLPQPMDTSKKPPLPDPLFPDDIPNGPFDLAKFLRPDQKTFDLIHRFHREQFQINGGKMNHYAVGSDAAGLTMSYFDASMLPEGRMAQNFTMCDNFFHGAFGGSFLNHIYLVSTAVPHWDQAPQSMIIKGVEDDHWVLNEAQVTPDGYVVNTTFSVNHPQPPDATDNTKLLPPLEMPTIGDRLNDKKISWAWYSGGWDDAMKGQPDKLFQYHHQPFVYFKNYNDGTALKKEHLKDEKDFLKALASQTLPAVSIIKPLGADNEHPGYASLAQGQQHVADLVQAVQGSPYWNKCAIIITYDENGGRWDHVAPPKLDPWGPGTRIPTIVISPFAKRHFVDHTQYDTSSVLKLIENRWQLPPLGERDKHANGLENAFDFSR